MTEITAVATSHVVCIRWR